VKVVLVGVGKIARECESGVGGLNQKWAAAEFEVSALNRPQKSLWRITGKNK
jgi:hypothetical protein